MVTPMAIAQALLPEFDHEMALTRSLLARIPDARAQWQPCPGARTLGELAVHMAGIPMRVVHAVAEGEPPQPPPSPEAWDSPAAVVSTFDAGVRAVRAALLDTSDDAMIGSFALQQAGSPISLTRLAAFRSLLFNHLVHHRGELSVYLRLCDVPLPSIYGPSADTAA
jgi:uncharacterized damage-inducible protein DinB